MTPRRERLASVPLVSLSDDLTAAEYAYRTAMMTLVKQADDMEPLAHMAEHLANMAAGSVHENQDLAPIS